MKSDPSMDTVAATARYGETARTQARDSGTGAERATVNAAGEVQTVVLDRYTLGRRLGSGAFATVYAAHDERLDRPVAVKVLPRERVNHARFQREARAAARLHHPAIVTLFEAAVDDEGAYLVSELVKGVTLDRALERGELSDHDILEIALALADALDHAHANGVVHRDVKPQNVLIPGRRARRGADAGLPAAKLTDFGVAHVVGSDQLTRTGDVIGTLAYMSPEGADGASVDQVGPASDLYSLALLTYEALTGVNPVADSLRHGARRRSGVRLPPLRRQRADLPRRLGAGLDRALEPRPDQRGGLADLTLALSEALGLVEHDAGVVAPARAVHPRPRSIPAMEPPAHSRTQTLELAPRGLLLVFAGVLAVPLGFVGLAGVWPALVSQTIRGFWRRAVIAAVGFGALGLAGALAPRNFYYHVAQLTPDSARAVGVGAGIWALGAALGPLGMRGRRPRLDLLRVTVIAAGVPIGLGLAGPHHIVGLLSGALVGWLLCACRPLIGVIRQARAPRGLS